MTKISEIMRAEAIKFADKKSIYFSQIFSPIKRKQYELEEYFYDYQHKNNFYKFASD